MSLRQASIHRTHISSISRLCSPQRRCKLPSSTPNPSPSFSTMSSKTTIAVCQILSTPDALHNLDVSSTLIRRAAKAGAKACFLPEAADFIAPTPQQCYDLSPPISRHPFTLGLRALAKELGIYISAGIHETPESDEVDDEPEGSIKVFNTHVLIGTDGSLLARYRKLHLYDVELAQPPLADGTPQKPKIYGESERVRKGMEILPPVPVEGMGNVALQICYDMRFPEEAIILRRLGADVLTFPSAFALKTGKDHWGGCLCLSHKAPSLRTATLNRAIAIQQQTYVIAAAQYGEHYDGRSSWGESVAFDPWGRPLGRLRSFDDTPAGSSIEVEEVYKTSGEFFLCEIDLGVVQETRKQIPLAIQKRTDMYGVVGQSLPPKKR